MSGAEGDAERDPARLLEEGRRVLRLEAAAVSAGMSQDLEEAVARGATHVRVGSDILGPRAPVG